MEECKLFMTESIRQKLIELEAMKYDILQASNPSGNVINRIEGAIDICHDMLGDRPFNPDYIGLVWRKR